jgi:hypothetical protein
MNNRNPRNKNQPRSYNCEHRFSRLPTQPPSCPSSDFQLEGIQYFVELERLGYLESQLRTLQAPVDAIVVDIRQPLEEMLSQVISQLALS